VIGKALVAWMVNGTVANKEGETTILLNYNDIDVNDLFPNGTRRV